MLHRIVVLMTLFISLLWYMACEHICEYEHAGLFGSEVSFFKFFIFIIYLWLSWVFVTARGLSLVAVSRGYSLLRCAGFSLQCLLLLWSTGSRRAGFTSCGMRAQ